MATTPLVILTGNIKIGADELSAVDVADAVTSVKFNGARAVVAIPATLATGEEGRQAGSATYEVEIGYLSDDSSATSLNMILWDALDPIENPTGELYVEATLRPGAVSASNPKWSGRFIVTGSAFGGEVGAVATDSQTFPMTGRPVRETT